LKHTTIVRTHFPRFKTPEYCTADIEKMKKENPDLAEIITSCKKVIHVNCLTEIEEPNQQTRKDSHNKMVVHLQGCDQIYHPVELDELNAKIEHFMTPLEKSQEDLKKLIAQNNTNSQAWESQKAQLQSQVNELQSKVAAGVGDHLKQRRPRFWEMLLPNLGGILGGVASVLTAPVKCVIQ